MKAISYLKQIRIMRSRIYSNMAEIEQLETMATKTTSVLGGERVQSSGSQQKMADCVVKIVDMKHQLEAEIESFIKYESDAMKLIAENCDADCTKMLFGRYFQAKTWEQIAVDMGFTYQWVSGGLHQRALSQVQKALDEREKDKNAG